MCAHGPVDPIPSTDALLPAGKLPPALLAALLHDLPTEDPALVLGPTVGEDAAVIDFVPEQDRLLVAKSDPITFATDEIGFYAVNVCANDLAVVGATPASTCPPYCCRRARLTAMWPSASFDKSARPVAN